MPLNPKSLQGLRNLFKPVEAAVSTAPEIKGALTTIAESPQAPSLLEAVMNKDMSRREFMKRAAATTANQAIPNAVKSLAVKQLAKEALIPESPKLKKLTENELAKYMDWGRVEDPGELIGTLESGLSYLNPGHLEEAFGFRIDPTELSVFYNPENLKDVIKSLKKSRKEFQSERSFYGDSDSEVQNVFDMMEGINLSNDPAASRKLEWNKYFNRPKSGSPQKDIYDWYTNPETTQDEANAWLSGITSGYQKKFEELNPLVTSDPRVTKVYPYHAGGNMQIEMIKGTPREAWEEVAPNWMSLKDYFKSYIEGNYP